MRVSKNTLIWLLVGLTVGCATTGDPPPPERSDSVESLTAGQDARAAAAAVTVERRLQLPETQRLVPTAVAVQPDLTTTARLQLHVAGVPVLGAELVARIGRDEGITVSGGLPEVPTIVTEPTLSRNDALTQAEGYTASGRAAADKAMWRHAAPLANVEASLAIALDRRAIRRRGVPIDATPNAADYERVTLGARLVYLVDSELPPRRVTIDAHTGAVISERSRMRHQLPPGGIGVPVPNAHTQHSGWVTLPAVYKKGQYTLQDQFGLQNILVTTTAAGPSSGLVFGYPPSDDNAWGNGQNYTTDDRGSSHPRQSAHGETAMVDAYYGVIVNGAMLEHVVGWGGADDGINEIAVHAGDPHFYPTMFDNAGYFRHRLFFGDATPGNVVHTQPHVVGHEAGHAFIHTALGPDAIANGTELAAINEAHADFTGELVEVYERSYPLPITQIASTGPYAMDWVQGDGTGLNRNFIRPSVDGWSVDAWSPNLVNLDEHYGSGPVRRMLYFLAEGAEPWPGSGTHLLKATRHLMGGMTGIGINPTIKIWYHAVLQHLAAGDKFIHLRAHCEASAAHFYGANSVEYKAVQDAFAAVAVGPPAERTPPQIAITTTGTGASVVVRVNATDPDGVSGGTIVAEAVDDHGQSTFFGGTFTQDSGSLSLGNVDGAILIISATATDEIGNSAERVAMRDYEKPTLIRYGCQEQRDPAGGFSSKAKQDCHVLVTDRMQLTSLQVWLDGEPQPTVTRPFQVDTLCTSYPCFPTGDEYDFDFEIDLSGLSTGYHVLSFEAFDGAGNSETGEFDVYMDATPPTLSLGVERQGAGFNVVATVDDNGPSRVDVSLDVGLLFHVCDAKVAPPGQVSCPSATLQPGSQLLSGVATDSYGNETFAFAVVEVPMFGDPQPQTGPTATEVEVNDLVPQVLPVGVAKLIGSDNPGLTSAYPSTWDVENYVVSVPPNKSLLVYSACDDLASLESGQITLDFTFLGPYHNDTSLPMDQGIALALLNSPCAGGYVLEFWYF